MRVNVLGPVQVFADDGSAVRFRQHKQRQVLAVLALHSRQPLGTELIVDMIWGDGAPAHANTAVRGYVRDLRRAGLAGRLVRDDGYRLELRDRELDSADFLGHAGWSAPLAWSRDPRAALEALTTALGLWRTPPLADIPDTGPMSAIRRRLLEEHRTAVDSLVDVRISLGQHVTVIGELTQRTAERPDHERVWCQFRPPKALNGRSAD
jgi:DNA-binding SARP family transcriptional activator